MKNLFTMMLVLLLVGVFAVAAFAQDGEPSGKQSKARTANYNEVASDTDGMNARNGNDDGYQEAGGPHDGEGPMGEGSGSGTAQGGSDGSGSGSGSGDGSGEKAFIDEDGDGFADCEVRLRKNGKLAGAMTETRVQDGDRTQQRGGGSGSGSGDSGEKIFDGEDGQGSMTGEMKGNANDHGPGGDDPAMGEGIGPNDGIGFGEPEDMDQGAGDMTRHRGKDDK